MARKKELLAPFARKLAERPAEEMFSEFGEKHDLIAAIREGEKAVQEGRMQPAEAVFTQLETKYGF